MLRYLANKVTSRLAGSLIGLLLLSLISVPAYASLDFQLDGLDGQSHKLSDYRGKWVLVNFWATWCPPCLEEIPELEIFHNNNQQDRAVVLGINLEEIDRGLLREFVDDQFVSYPILLTGPDTRLPFGRIPGLPTSFLVSPEGKVTARVVGAVTAESIENYIDNYQERQP